MANTNRSFVLGGQGKNQCHNYDKSAASFYPQVAAWVPDIVCNLYLVKYNKIANNSTTTEDREKMSTDFEYLKFLKNLGIHLAKFKSHKSLLDEIRHHFLVISKLFTV
jgi:hypothetical protein